MLISGAMYLLHLHAFIAWAYVTVSLSFVDPLFPNPLLTVQHLLLLTDSVESEQILKKCGYVGNNGRFWIYIPFAIRLMVLFRPLNKCLKQKML